MAQILKSGGTILRTGQSIFITGQIQVPVLNLDAGSLTGSPGEAVSLWPEPSGNNAFQTVAISQPLIETVGSKKCVRFDGADDWLQFTSSVVCTTMFAVVEFMSATAGFTSLVSSAGTDYYFDSDGQMWFRNLASRFGGEPQILGQPINRLYTNGNRIIPISAQNRIAPRHLLCLDVTGVARIIDRINKHGFDESSRLNLRLYRLMVYNQRLTDIERNIITQQLMTLYAI